jgi:Barrel-sandwich domain of CusB or HlyD membrane-fusion
MQDSAKEGVMQPIGIEFTVKEIDLLLDELEQLADDASMSSREFYSQALDRFRHLVSASAALLLHPLVDKTLGPIAIAGSCDWTQLSKQLPLAELIEQPHFVESQRIFVYPVCQVSQQQCLLLLRFANSIDEISRRDLTQLGSAFSEVIRRRQQHDNAEVRTQYLTALNQLIANLHTSESPQQLDVQFANDLLVVLRADRVSVARNSWFSPTKITAVSNHTGPIKRSDSIKSIETVCHQVLRSGQPESRMTHQNDSAEAGKLASSYIAFPLKQESNSTDCAILVEWDQPDSFLKGSMILNQIAFMLASTWNAHQRWLRLPRLLRSYKLPEFRKAWHKRLFRIGLGIAVVLSVFWLLTNPSQFRLEIDGAVQPKVQRNVYAMLDGTIEKILVKDSERVTQGQMIATMKSASLEMQMQEVVGDLSAIKEKRDALALSINQLDGNQESKNAMMNRLAAETRQLEIQQDTLLQKLKALKAESAKLNIVSPIDGVVVARDLDKLLDARPVRRGDALLKIVDPSSELHLHLQIADADVGHLKNKLLDDPGQNSLLPEKGSSGIDFVFVSKPDQRFKANVMWLSEVARNPRGDGVFVDAIATLEPDAIPHAHMGATVKAYAYCGQRPLWFVFSRPFIEAIQRKLWF